VKVDALEDVVSVAAGVAHTCALRADGVPLCWGSNFTGQLGDGTTADRRTPVEIPSFASDTVSLPGQAPPLENAP
jgi:alpha-tubulin suppressor-like RCC1 family protein